MFRGAGVLHKLLLIACLILFPFTTASFASISQCDLLSASPQDKDAVSPGVAYEVLRSHSQDAITACEVAISETPEDPRIQYQLGRAYLSSGDDDQAAKWFESSAEQKYPAAMNAFGVLLNHGRGTEINNDRAFNFIKAAAESGNVPGMANLGAFYNNVATHSSATVVNRELSIEWLHKAADEDDPLALARLGWNYGMGDTGVTKDKEKSYGFLERALELNEESAEYIIIEVTQSGFGDWQEAQKIQKKFKNSKNRLVMLSAKGYQYTEKLIRKFTEVGFRFDRPEVEPLYVREFIFDQDFYHAEIMDASLEYMNSRARAAAEEFIVAARAERQRRSPPPSEDDAPVTIVVPQVDFGPETECDALASSPNDTLSKGAPVQYAALVTNSELAVAKCRAVVDQAEINIRAKYLLGRALIAAGQDAEAFKWFGDAANAGYPAAMNAYGVLFNHGRGVEPDNQQSFAWFKKAAENGSPAGAINLATAYYMGIGTDLNASFGTHWTKIGAEAKDPKALFTLGAGYAVSPIWYRNVDVRRDMEKGVELLLEAHELGDLDATYALFAVSQEPSYGGYQQKLGLKSGKHYLQVAYDRGDRQAALQKFVKKINSAESVMDVINELKMMPHPVDRADHEPVYAVDSYMDNEHVLGEILSGYTFGKSYQYGVHQEVTKLFHELTDTGRSFERPKQ